MIQLHFLTNFWEDSTQKKVQDKIFKIDYFIPNIFGYI